MAPTFGICLVATLSFQSLLHVQGHQGINIDAMGQAAASSRALEEPSLAEMVRRAKLNFANTLNTAKLMRAEVRNHVPAQMEQAAGLKPEMDREQLEKAFALLDSGEVNCSASNPEAVAVQLCHILSGNNTQVSGKLERAVKGLSLRPKAANASELVVADKIEDGLLTHLRAALWDMWFCTKRKEPPCDPMTSSDPRVKAAREQAFDALHAIHLHAQAQPASAVEAPAGGAAVASAASSAAPQPAALLEKESSRQLLNTRGHRQTPVAPASQFATNVITNMLTPPGVTGKLYEAINDLDVDTQLETDIVRIENDEDGAMKKLKADLLILHECASMPQCPATNCCTPKNPTQAKYIQARNDAYVAYHNMEHDNDMAKATYVDLLKEIAGGKKKGAKLSGKVKGGKDASKVIIKEEEIPGNSTGNSSNSTEAAPPVPVDDGSFLLLCALGLIAVIVVCAIGFVLSKISSGGKQESAAAGGGGEEWQGEKW